MNKTEDKKSKTNNQSTEFKREGNSMKRILTTAAVLTLLMASVSSAGMSNARFEVRPFTMGGESVNMIMKSQGNIWLFPQTINQYPNQAEGVFDNGDNSSTSSVSSKDTFARFGVHYQFNEGNNPFVVGVYVNNAATYRPFGSGSGRPFNNNVSLLPNRQVDVFYGRNLGGNPFGAHLYTFNSNNEREGNNGYRAGLTAIGVSLGMSTGGGAWDWALDFGTTTFTDETTDGGGNITQQTEPDGSFYFGATGRRWFPVNSKITWVAHGMVHYNKLSWTDPNTTAPNAPGQYDMKTTQVNAGWGLNFTPTSKVLAVMDVMFEYQKLTDERDTNGDGALNVDMTNKTNNFPMSYSIGFDAEVLSWFDLRMGASNYRKVFTSENNITSTNKIKTTQHQNETFLGFGLHFGDLEIDAYVDPRLAINGPDFISGDDTRNMFMTLAGTMHF